MKANIIIILFYIIALAACNHKTNCRIPTPTIDSLTLKIKSATSKQSIRLSCYEPQSHINWVLTQDPLSQNIYTIVNHKYDSSFEYLFNRKGVYKFLVTANKFNCFSDSVPVIVNTNGNSISTSQCPMP